MKSRRILLMIAASFTLSACGGSNSGTMTTPPPPVTAPNEWTWVGGSDLGNQTGVYGTLGTPASSNVPGAREQAVSWTDASANFWLFGGSGYDSTGNPGTPLNDLWRYSAGEWTWESGANVAGQLGTYGTQGMAAPGNVPSARFGAVGSSDSAGNLWLFGGYFISPNGPAENGILNNLWKYSSGEWTWMSGSDAFNQVGTYGTQGMAASGNVPGARFSATSWIDMSGNFWLFGGAGVDSDGNCCVFFNDLWEYSAGEWTWVSGSDVGDQPGVYGSLGVAASGNIPSAREQAVSWTDASGNIWLFGGSGLENIDGGNLNDLWKYSNGEWTWMSGSSSPNQVGVYGTLGTASPSSVPGARFGAVGWADTSGNLWLFGGSNLNEFGAGGTFSDLWKYSASQWTWMGGSNALNQPATYGTQGMASASNAPGARLFAIGWTDVSGNFWLFGGSNGILTTLSTEPPSLFNDLWEYQP